MLLLVDAVAALRLGRPAIERYLARLGVLAVAALGVFLLGYLSYLVILGSLSPLDLLRPTFKFFGENSQQSAAYQHPVSSWLLHEPRIWAPVIMSLALVAMLRRRIFESGLVARIAQFCGGYTAFLWLYRFLVTSSVIETWWAYSVIVVAVAPAVGVLINELTRVSSTARRWTVLASAGLVVTVLLIRNAPSPVSDAYREVTTNETLFVALLATAASAALVLGSSHVWRRGVASTVLAVLLAAMLYSPSMLEGRGTTGVFVSNGDEEWNAYAAGERFVHLVQNYDAHTHRVFLWYPGTLGYVSIAWAELPQTGDTLNQVGVGEALGRLTPLARARLALPEVHYLLVMAPHNDELRAARAALAAGGVGGSVVRGGQLAGRQLSFLFVALAKK